MQVSVHIATFALQDDRLQVLLLRGAPLAAEQRYALPGANIHPEEGLEAVARGELSSYVGTPNFYLEQLYTFGSRDRDPRPRSVSIVYYALLPGGTTPDTCDGANETCWFDIWRMPKLAYGHRRAVQEALRRLRNKLDYSTVAFELLPEKFTLSQLQRLYEAILGERLDKRNFRRTFSSLDLLTPLDESTQKSGNTVQLYSLARNVAVPKMRTWRGRY